MALVLDGVNQYARLDGSFGSSNETRSMCGWIKTANLTNFSPAFGLFDASSVFSFAAIADNDGSPQVKGRVRTVAVIDTAYVTYTDNEWTPIVITFDTATDEVALYLGTGSGAPVTNTGSNTGLGFDTVLIGCRTNSSDVPESFFFGEAAVIRMWRRKLTAGEIDTIRNATSVADVDSVSATSLDFSEDLIGSAGSLTLFNSPTVNNDSPFTVLPTLTTVPATITPGQSFQILGTNLGATQGTVEIEGVAQTITGWTDTQIDGTGVLGNNSYGAGKTITVTKGE